MSLLSDLGVGAELAKPIDAVSNLYTTDKAKLEGEQKLAETQEKPQLAQLSNNAIMIASTHLFNSGWQPLVGWVSGFLVLLYYFPQILIATYVWGGHCISTGNVIPFPIPSDNIINLVYLLFGMGVHSIAKKVVS
jgi:hypothetical protein